MTDRELLELAAKAAGMGQLVWGEKYKVGDTEVDCTDLPYVSSESPDESPAYWNPLADDGDAFRLMVGLGMVVYPARKGSEDKTVWIEWSEPMRPETHFDLEEPCGKDFRYDVRRAIVRAAAEIGRAMP